MKSALSSWAAIGAAVGAAVAIVIYVSSFVPAIADIWWWNNLIFVLWPSFFVLMGFAGPVDEKTLMALAVAVVLNAGLYAIIASALYATIGRGRKTNSPVKP